MRPEILVVGAVENVYGRHLKYGYNVCNISWVSQAKMVSKCNRIASLVIFNNKIFMGEISQTTLTRGGRTPSHALLPLLPSALGERRQRSMAVPLSKSRRRPWILYTLSIKETQTFKWILFRVKVIGFQNDSISVAWSFNKELYNRVSSKTGLRVLFCE